MKTIKKSLVEIFAAEKAAFKISNEQLGQLARMLPYCSKPAVSLFAKGDFYEFLSFIIADFHTENSNEDFCEIFDTFAIPSGISIGWNNTAIFDFCNSFGICVGLQVDLQFGNQIPWRVQFENGDILE